jgi:hypothetical protein
MAADVHDAMAPGGSARAVTLDQPRGTKPACLVTDGLP